MKLDMKVDHRSRLSKLIYDGVSCVKVEVTCLCRKYNYERWLSKHVIRVSRQSDHKFLINMPTWIMNTIWTQNGFIISTQLNVTKSAETCPTVLYVKIIKKEKGKEVAIMQEIVMIKLLAVKLELVDPFLCYFPNLVVIVQ